MSGIDRWIADLATGQQGVVALRQLLRAGISARSLRLRVADGRLHRVFRGVYSVGSAWPTLRGRWMGATLALGDDALLSHLDGSVLLDLQARRGPWVHVTVPGRKPRSQPGIQAHRIGAVHEADRERVDRIPVTSVARTLLDLGTMLDRTAHRRAYERAERIGALDLARIDDVLARNRGHPGTGRLRSLRAYDPTVASRAESELEALFVDVLREHGLPMPQLGALVDGFVVDAYWPEADLVVELDGYENHRDRDTFERDRLKAATLRRAGREFVALTHRQVTRRPGWTAQTVADMLAPRR